MAKNNKVVDKQEVTDDAGTTVVKTKEVKEAQKEVPNAHILKLMHTVHRKVAQGK